MESFSLQKYIEIAQM